MVIALTIVMTSSQAKALDYSGYLGVNSGFANLQGVNSEASKSGYLLGVKGLFTSNFDTFVVDAGLGYYSQEVTSTNNYIKTKTATLDFDARYVLVNNYQLGVGLRSDLGTDNSGTEYIGKNTQSNMLLAKLVVPDKFNSYPIRYEFGIGSTVGQARSLSTAFVGIQIGLPESKKVQSVVKPVVTAPVPVAPVAQVEKDESDFKVDLKLAKIYFPTNQSNLDSKAQEKLSKLAQFLAKNQKSWGRLKISGHTDIQGNDHDNERLSQDRADEVMKVLVSSGVNESKVSSFGYGSKKPAVNSYNEVAWQKNRRTEIEFFGVSNRKQINNEIVRILTNAQ